MFAKETMLSGAPLKCSTCRREISMEILSTPAGHYLGGFCGCGPYSRESHYFEDREEAEAVLEQAREALKTVRAGFPCPPGLWWRR